MLKKEEGKRKTRKEEKRLRDMTKRVVCRVKTMFPRKTPSPYNFEKEMKRWLEKEEKKRRARRTRKKTQRRKKKCLQKTPQNNTQVIYLNLKGFMPACVMISNILFANALPYSVSLL